MDYTSTRILGGTMIRRFKERDLDEVMSIWLTANIEAHSFIEADYWRGNFDYVKDAILTAEVFVSEIEGQINGFIGIIDNYIAGIFVKSSERTKGIGSDLLNTVKKEKEILSLKVYTKNENAVSFYRNAGFKIEAKDMDEETSEMEYMMTWKAIF